MIKINGWWISWLGCESPKLNLKLIHRLFDQRCANDNKYVR